MKNMYYKLLVEYSSLIEQKQFNEMYFDTKRLDTVKEKLSNTIQKLQRKADVMAMDCLYHNDITQAKKYIKHSQRLKSLLYKAIAEEIITKEDYESTYLDTTIHGYTIPQILIYCIIAGIILFVLTN